MPKAYKLQVSSRSMDFSVPPDNTKYIAMCGGKKIAYVGTATTTGLITGNVDAESTANNNYKLLDGTTDTGWVALLSVTTPDASGVEPEIHIQTDSNYKVLETDYNGVTNGTHTADVMVQCDDHTFFKFLPSGVKSDANAWYGRLADTATGSADQDGFIMFPTLEDFELYLDIENITMPNFVKISQK